MFGNIMELKNKQINKRESSGKKKKTNSKTDIRQPIQRV